MIFLKIEKNRKNIPESTGFINTCPTLLGVGSVVIAKSYSIIIRREKYQVIHHL